MEQNLSIYTFSSFALVSIEMFICLFGAHALQPFAFDLVVDFALQPFEINIESNIVKYGQLSLFHTMRCL